MYKDTYALTVDVGNKFYAADVCLGHLYLASLAIYELQQVSPILEWDIRCKGISMYKDAYALTVIIRNKFSKQLMYALGTYTLPA